MSRATPQRRDRSRGRIEFLPSGSLRVVVFVGRDPLTKRRLYLREMIPPGPTAEADAEKALRRLGDLNIGSLQYIRGEHEMVSLGMILPLPIIDASEPGATMAVLHSLASASRNIEAYSAAVRR